MMKPRYLSWQFGLTFGLGPFVSEWTCPAQTRVAEAGVLHVLSSYALMFCSSWLLLKLIERCADRRAARRKPD